MSKFQESLRASEAVRAQAARDVFRRFCAQHALQQTTLIVAFAEVMEVGSPEGLEIFCEAMMDSVDLTLAKFAAADETREIRREASKRRAACE